MTALYAAMAFLGWFVAMVAGYAMAEGRHNMGTMLSGLSFGLIVAALVLITQ